MRSAVGASSAKGPNEKNFQGKFLKEEPGCVKLPYGSHPLGYSQNYEKDLWNLWEIKKDATTIQAAFKKQKIYTFKQSILYP